MCILGIPAGVELRYEYLDELIKDESFDYFETMERNLILYKKHLSPNEVLDFKIEFTAKYPGKFTSPPSRCYLYYSSEFKYWIGGLIKHAPAICALTNTFDCYQRYRLASFAPFTANWGYENRTCCIRVKSTGDGSTRYENRIGGAAANVYLLMAAEVAAGIDGLKNKIMIKETSAAYAQEGEKLPKNLKEAIVALENDKVICEAFGEEFMKIFLAIKKHELKKAESNGWTEKEEIVQQWERDVYLEYC